METLWNCFALYIGAEIAYLRLLGNRIINLKFLLMSHAGTISIPDIDFDYKIWKNRIAFLRNRIRLYQARIKELKAASPEWKHEQNLLELELAFHSLRNDLIDVQTEIRVQEEQIPSHAPDYPITETHQDFDSHETINLMMKDASMKMDELERAFLPYRL